MSHLARTSPHLHKRKQKISRKNTPQLTKNKNSGISKDRAGNGQPLPLSSRKICTTISKPCIVPIWQILDKAVKKCCPTSFNNLAARRILRPPFATWSRESHCDVVVNCHVK